MSTLPDQVAGWKTGYKFLLDLCGAGKKFTDAQRADLMHLDEKLLMRNKKALQKRNERRRVAALDERIGPLVASEKRLPYDEDSLCEVMKHLSLLRYANKKGSPHTNSKNDRPARERFFIFRSGWGNDCIPAYSFPVNHSHAQHSGVR